jgi:hypothetical protein
MLEYASVALEAVEGSRPVGVEARVQDVMVGSFDDVDAVELDETESPDLVEGRGGGCGAGHISEEPLSIQKKGARGGDRDSSGGA